MFVISPQHLTNYVFTSFGKLPKPFKSTIFLKTQIETLYLMNKYRLIFIAIQLSLVVNECNWYY